MAFRIEYTGKIIGNNQRYAYRTKKINSKEYIDFKNYIGWICKDQNKNEKLIENKVEFSLFYNSNLDIDNMLKGIFDSLEGIVYNNDRQIKRLRIEESKQIEKGFLAYVKALKSN